MSKSWSFEDPENLAVFTTREILERVKPIKYVSHDEEDGAWQFHTGEHTKEEDARIITLEEATKIDPSIFELANLPLGWIAFRRDKTEEWTREKY
ncbi:hypothetical protein G5B47_13780 [Paenibacillus sp. 7124]|uniref:DUF2185 domain-containing protein n=1 Tax=Paenibacillus apii TaxID=1850370 RepID=A0A6M1PIU8_9BACL|nr:hypothetical protein [Paenibacillus apii]NGM83487.1 hypothetical protein [Paenibacillus apii]NJJ39121.1 hypothetical protein [Paenibacillus apii]